MSIGISYSFSSHTPAFEPQLIQADLTHIGIPLTNMNPAEIASRKNEYRAKLDQIYQVLSQQPTTPEQLNLLSHVLTRIGRLRYEEAYPACMVLMRASLNVQFAAFKIFETLSFNPKEHQTLGQVEEYLYNHTHSSAFDSFMLDSDMNAVASRILDLNLPTEHLLRLAFTLSWYSNGLINTAGFAKNDSQEIQIVNNKRFDQIYSLCEKILKAANCDAANIELAEMYYNGLRGAELRKNPMNIVGAHQWLDKAKELNPDPEMAARVANLKSCDWAGIDSQKSRAFLYEAIQIRESFPKEKQNPFLVANLQNRLAGTLLNDCKFDEAERVIDAALQYSESARGSRDAADKLLDLKNSHQYFGVYDMTKAKILLQKNDFQGAEKYLSRALETFEFHSQSSQDLIRAVNAMKSKLPSQ
jgi:tetratricopeptide (TPR) repeat protein